MENASYSIRCWSCSKRYDALAEPWCDCLYKDRTIRCPHCGRCFCAAPTAVKQTFWIDAPSEMWQRKRQEARSRVDYTNPPVDAVTRPLVLVVDDEDEIRAVAIRTVTSLGYSVVAARNGEEGMAVARSYKPDVVLTDAMMPKLDGREMGLRIKEDPETANARVVVLTSLYTDPRYKYEAMKTYKADAYLAKPVDAQTLEDVLRKMTQ